MLKRWHVSHQKWFFSQRPWLIWFSEQIHLKSMVSCETVEVQKILNELNVHILILGESFFICTTELGVEVVFISLIGNAPHLTHVLKKLEAFVQTSRLTNEKLKNHWRIKIRLIPKYLELNDLNPKAVYFEMEVNMDKMANWTYVGFTKLTFPTFVISNLLLTAVNYFILDMGSESYFLPSPILYVHNFIEFISLNILKWNSLSLIIGCLLTGRHRLDTWSLSLLSCVDHFIQPTSSCLFCALQSDHFR